jgi:acyl-CoA synthetase (AMP-forming)/AMP-acid ligase II
VRTATIAEDRREARSADGSIHRNTVLLPRLTPDQDQGMPTEEALSFAGAVARRAEARPDDEVVRLAGSAGWSAAALWQRSLAIAGGLADLVDAGDAVATSVPPGPAAIAVTTALSALGAVEMPLGADVDPRWARRLAESTGCVC